MTVVDLYTIQIISEHGPDVGAEMIAKIAATAAEAEENISDLLPTGFSVRIRRWNDPDPDEGNDERECEHKWRDYSEYGGDFKPGELTCKYCGATKGNDDE